MVEIKEKLRNSVVGIAGLGGLGSTVVAALARAGTGRLIIADCDYVEESNLNRQHYFTDQLGKAKVTATIENLRRINPSVRVDGFSLRLDETNIPEVFADADIIAECFDSARAKQMIVETVLAKMKDKKIVSATGLAGFGRSNEIKTRRISNRLILVGDGQSGTDSCDRLFASRVWIVASHQANAVIELLLNGT